MPRLLRTLSKAGELVEITCRTFQSRALLCPSPALRKTFVGVLGRALELYPVRLHEVHLEPLPCWQHLEGSTWRGRVASMVTRIEKKTLKMHHDQGTVPRGARAVRKVHPHRKPDYESRSPRPMVHAATRRVRQRMIDAYREFEAAYRLASELLRSGQWDVTFPPGCWTPHLLVPGPG